MAQRANGRRLSVPGLHPGAVENPARRWRSGVCFDLPGGGRQYIVSGPMHFQQGGSWQEIDNRWRPAAAPWDYQMLQAEYQAYLLQQFNAGQILRLVKAGHHLTFQPMALGFTNDLHQIQQIAIPENLEGVVTNSGSTSLCQGGRIDWQGGYGPGLDFAWIPSTHFFRKLLTIGSLAALPTPEQYILDGGNPVLALDFIFTSDLDLYVDGELWDRQARVQTAERIEFRQGETVHWWWGIPRATDADGEQQPGTIELRKVGNSLYVSVRVPWSWLETAAHPVVLDPDTYYGETTDGNVLGVNADYATARSTAAAHDVTADNIFMGQQKAAGFFWSIRIFLEFDTSGIGAGKRVDDCLLYLTADTDGSDTDFDVEIVKCTWTSPITVGNRDANYDAALAAAKDVTWRNTFGIGFHQTYASPSLDNARVDIIGMTQLALVSSRDIAATEPAGNEYLYIDMQEHATQAWRPYLSIMSAPQFPRIIGGGLLHG